MADWLGIAADNDDCGIIALTVNILPGFILYGDWRA
jgi:hypothetical protein